MSKSRKSKGTLERVTETVSGAAEAVWDAGASAIETVSGALPGAKSSREEEKFEGQVFGIAGKRFGLQGQVGQLEVGLFGLVNQIRFGQAQEREFRVGVKVDDQGRRLIGQILIGQIFVGQVFVGRHEDQVIDGEVVGRLFIRKEQVRSFRLIRNKEINIQKYKIPLGP